MNFSLISVYVDAPFYLAMVSSIVALAAIAALITAGVGVTRRLRHESLQRTVGTVAFHGFLATACVAYFVAVGIYWVASERGIAKYETTFGTSAPMIAAALRRDIAVRVVAGGFAAGLVALSAATWRVVPRQDHK